jgi:hypothetical protein
MSLGRRAKLVSLALGSAALLGAHGAWADKPLDPGPAAPLPVAPAPPSAEAPADAGGPQFSGYLYGAMAMSFGALPAPSPGLAVTAGIQYGNAALELSGAGYARREAWLLGESTGLVTDFMTADLRFSWRTRLTPRWVLGPTATLQVGEFSAHGIEIEGEPASRVSWAAAGVGELLAFRITRSWSLVEQADLLLPFGRSHFNVDGTTVHRPAPVVGAVRLGFEVTFR